MAYSTLSDLFTGICDAIRAKKGTTGTINHQDIPSEIESIESGGEYCVYCQTVTPPSTQALHMDRPSSASSLQPYRVIITAYDPDDYDIDTGKLLYLYLEFDTNGTMNYWSYATVTEDEEMYDGTLNRFLQRVTYMMLPTEQVGVEIE